MDKARNPPLADLMGESLTKGEVEQFRVSQRRRRKAKFVGGPFLWQQYCLAVRLPGKALAVWQLVHHQTRLRRKSEITLSKELLTDCGISRDANRRALAALEHIGLVSVIRSKGRSVRVSLVELSDPSDE